MQKFTILIKANFDIPDNIKTLSSDEWEIILTNTSELLIKHDNILASINQDELKNTIIKKYNAQINNLNKKLEIKDSSYNELYNKYKELEKNKEDEIYTKLEQQKNILYERYKDAFMNDLNREKDLLKSTYEYKLSSKDQEVKDITNLVTVKLTEQFQYEKSILERNLNNAIANVTDIEKKYTSRLEDEKQKIIEAYKSKSAEYEENIKNMLDIKYTTKYEMLQKQLEQYKNTTLDLQNIYETKIKDIEKTTIDKIQTKHLSEIKLLEKDISLYKNTIKTLEEDKKKVEELYKQHINNLNHTNNKQEETKNLLSEINTRLEPVLKYYSGSNEEKGSGGEDYVKNILSKNSRYEESIIEDCSHEEARGDVYYMKGGMRCLIEVKNKKDITAKDLEKFERDINESSASERNINCGLFISLRTNKFPKRQNKIMHLESINNIPVVLMHLELPNYIYYPLALLEKILSVDMTNTERVDILVKTYKDSYSYLINMQKFFDNEIKNKKTELKRLYKQQDETNKLYSSMHLNYGNLINNDSKTDTDSNNNSIDSDNEEKEIKTIPSDPIEIKQLIKETYINLLLENKSATVADICTKLSIELTTISVAGGYKNIVQEAQTEFVQSIINQDIIDKMKEYKQENERYPNRKESIDEKIFTDTSLRRLNKVVKKKKLMDYIYTVCDSNTDPIVDDAEDEETNSVELSIRKVRKLPKS